MRLPVQPWAPSAPVSSRAWLNADRALPVVWLALVPENDDALAPLTADLAPGERARAATYRLAEDRRRSILGRALVRRLLAPVLGLAPATLQIAVGDSGKPYLVIPHGAPPAPRFNLSHSGDFVLLAVHPSREVGVDIERVHADFDPTELSTHVFGPDAHATWLALPAARRTEEFFRSWTRHEAQLKALGTGFATQRPRIAPHPNPKLEIADLVLPDECHVGACAWIT